MKDVVAAFKEEYIKEGMSDFEKEMEIIRYLVENVDYDLSLEAEMSHDSYGALVNGEAVCAGYTFAFWQLADACGLEVVYESGDAWGGAHAWNKIKLDGKWYNVDVTGEDPLVNESTENGYGFDRLRNYYINVTDEVIERDHKPEMVRDMAWTGYKPGTEKYKEYAATAEKYGPTVVEYYLLTGKVDTSMSGDKWRKYLMSHPDQIRDGVLDGSNASLSIYGQRMDDGSNYFEALEETAVTAYLRKAFEEGIQRFYLTTQTKEKPEWLTAEWLVKQMGGTLENWVTNRAESYDGDYWAYEITYDGEISDLKTTEEMRKLFEEARTDDGKNVVKAKAEAKEYVTEALEAKRLMKDKPKTVTVIYEGMATERLNDEDSRDWIDYIKKVEETRMDTVTVDGTVYVICRYTLTYKTLEEYLDLEKGASNLFETSGTKDLEYLKKKIDAVIESEESDVVYVYYKKGVGEALTSELKDYAESKGMDIGISLVRQDERELSYEGVEYESIFYLVEYYGPAETKNLKKSINRDVLATPSNAKYSQ